MEEAAMTSAVATIWVPSKIVSGGQTGVDRGAIEGALQLGIPYGGWVPRGRRAEDGRVPDRYASLVETTSAGYAQRTRANIVAADATLVLTHTPPSTGTLFTINEAERLLKPLAVVDFKWSDERCTWEIREFMSRAMPTMLNVAGPRESKTPGAQERTRFLLVAALRRSVSDLPF